MPHPRMFLRILAGSLLALYTAAALAQNAAPVPPTQAPTKETVKTGKERLSDKASDEQRVDNCKVPPERRGPAARPDACGPDVNTVLTN